MSIKEHVKKLDFAHISKILIKKHSFCEKSTMNSKLSV